MFLDSNVDMVVVGVVHDEESDDAESDDDHNMDDNDDMNDNDNVDDAPMTVKS